LTDNELTLDSKALEKMGLNSEAIFTVEYDLNSVKKIPKNATPETKAELKRYNKLARIFRNRLHFILKFKLRATRHLESCWIVSECNLEDAQKELETFKAAMKNKGFKDVDGRIRIIPILTTENGHENFQDKKADFILEFAMEHVKYCEKARREQKMSRGILWRCKEAYSACSTLREELKGHPRYNEMVDTIEILHDLINLVEPLTKTTKEKND